MKGEAEGHVQRETQGNRTSEGEPSLSVNPKTREHPRGASRGTWAGLAQGGRCLPMLTELLAALQVSPCSEELSLPQRHWEGLGVRAPFLHAAGGLGGGEGRGPGAEEKGSSLEMFQHHMHDGLSPKVPTALLPPKSPRTWQAAWALREGRGEKSIGLIRGRISSSLWL